MKLNIKKIVTINLFFLVLANPLIATENSQEKKKGFFSKVFGGLKNIKNKVKKVGESTGTNIWGKITKISRTAKKGIKTLAKGTGNIGKKLVKGYVNFLENITLNSYFENNPYGTDPKNVSGGEIENIEKELKEENNEQEIFNKEETKEKLKKEEKREEETKVEGKREEETKVKEKKEEETKVEKIEVKEEEKITNLEINEKSICCWC